MTQKDRRDATCRQSQPCDAPSPKSPAPRHPAPWLQREAKLYERIYEIALHDVAETSGLHLVPAPPTPICARRHDSVFIQKLHRALELVVFARELRRSMYGRDIAEDTRPGHTPPGLREKLRQEAEAWVMDPSSESDTPLTPAENSFPHDHGERALRPVPPLPEQDPLDRTETTLNRKRRLDESEIIEIGSEISKRRR